MLLQALRDLPVAERTRVVLRADQPQHANIVTTLKNCDPRIDIVTLVITNLVNKIFFPEVIKLYSHITL